MANEIELLDAVPEEDRTLQYTQDIRKKLVKKLTTAQTGEEQMPSEKADQIVLLQTLTDIDRQILTSKRIKSDDKTADAAAKAATIMAKILTSVSPKKFMNRVESIIPPSLPNEIYEGQFVTGEMKTGTQFCDFEQFSARFISPDEAAAA